MTRNDLKRKRIFDLYSENWILYSKFLNLPNEFKGKNLYACPMCLDVFDEGFLNQGLDRRLTLEDVPPKKLGGKPIILTCNSCNNLSGSHLDSHLLNQTKAYDFLSKKEGASKEAVIQFNGGTKKVKGILENLPNDTFGIRLNRKSNPSANDEIDEFFKNSENGQMHFKITGGRLRNVNAAKLRIAYLLAFSKFGYGFILNNEMTDIRRQILNPQEEILSHYGIIRMDTEEDLQGIFIIKGPKEMVSFLVVFDIIENENKTTIPIILPGPAPGSSAIYDVLSNRKMDDLKIEAIPDLNYLTDEQFVMGAREIWHYHKEN